MNGTVQTHAHKKWVCVLTRWRHARYADRVAKERSRRTVEAEQKQSGVDGASGRPTLFNSLMPFPLEKGMG